MAIAQKPTITRGNASPRFTIGEIKKIISGTKTESRRLLKKEKIDQNDWQYLNEPIDILEVCPALTGWDALLHYIVDGEITVLPVPGEMHPPPLGRYRNRTMIPPSWARYFMKLEQVTAVELQSLTEEDAIAEGVDLNPPFGIHWQMAPFAATCPHIAKFADDWDELHRSHWYNWFCNPIVRLTRWSAVEIYKHEIGTINNPF